MWDLSHASSSLPALIIIIIMKSCGEEYDTS